jgi:mono/diheme cytochrome c family protein
MYRLSSIAAFVLLFSTNGFSQSNDKLDDAAAVAGERLFATYCRACHGKSAQGDGPLAADLKVKPADLTKLSGSNAGTFPYEMVVKTIDHGRSVRGHGTEDMPAWGDAFKMTSQSGDEPKQMMRDLAHYLWSLQPK